MNVQLISFLVCCYAIQSFANQDTDMESVIASEPRDRFNRTFIICSYATNKHGTTPPKRMDSRCFRKTSFSRPVCKFTISNGVFNTECSDAETENNECLGSCQPEYKSGRLQEGQVRSEMRCCCFTSGCTTDFQKLIEIAQKLENEKIKYNLFSNQSDQINHSEVESKQ